MSSFYHITCHICRKMKETLLQNLKILLLRVTENISSTNTLFNQRYTHIRLFSRLIFKGRYRYRSRIRPGHTEG